MQLTLVFRPDTARPILAIEAVNESERLMNGRL